MPADAYGGIYSPGDHRSPVAITPRNSSRCVAQKFPTCGASAPDVPKLLADLIERCTNHDPADRPASFAEIAQLLGPSTSAGRRKLADVLAKSGRRTAQINWSWRARSGLQRSATQLMATAACLVLLAAATWPLWRSRQIAGRTHGGNSLGRPCSKNCEVSSQRRSRSSGAAGKLPIR